MKLIKCFTYVLCLVAVLVSVSPAQTNLGSDQMRQRRSELQRALRAFADWAKRYATKSRAIPATRPIQEGIALAKQRRDTLSKLVESAPEVVLSAGIPSSLRNALPDSIRDELETPASGIGDFLVICVMPAEGADGQGGIQRLVRLDGRTYPAAIYGRRLGQTTKYHIPLHGVVLNGILALDQNVLEELKPEEAAGSSIHDLTAAAGPLAGSGPAVLARTGGTVYRFASAEHLRQTEALLENAESGLSPNAVEPVSVLLERARFPEAGRKVPPRPLILPAPGTREYKALVIRVDFPDLQGDPRMGNGWAPLTAPAVQDVADGQVGPYYQRSSYGKATFNFTVTPQLYRLPATAAYYATTGYYNQLYDDAVAASEADYAITSYDKVIVLSSSLSFLPGSQFQSYGGLTAVGTPRVWVNGEFDFRVVAHELGHTFGLPHASLWDTSDDNPVSLNGSAIQYADPFDTMGSNFGSGTRADFNPWFKYLLNWIQDPQVQTVIQNGIYRVYRFDDAQATGTLALKVAKDATRDYWIGYRRNFPENPELQHGAYVVWGYHDRSQMSNLLGLGPTLNKATDPGLVVGDILADPQANLIIAPVAQGGEAPHEYLDVQITFAPPPVVTRQPNSQVALAGESAEFTVQVAENSGYAWQRQASGTHEWVTLGDGGGYSGTSTTTLQIATTAMMNGDAFRCVLTNAEGGFNGSQPVVLTVSEFGVETLTGQPNVRGNADGFGALALLSSPMGIAVDRAGNTYIADTGNHTIRKVSPTGLVSTLAGLAGVAGSVDGVGQEARFDMPVGITVDSAGVVYVVDQFDSTIRRITPDGAVTTLQVGLADPANTTQIAPNPALNHPNGIAVDCSGNLYIADTGNNTIRKMAPDGSLSTVAGANGVPGAADGQGAAARFNAPFGIAVDLDGNMYVADQVNSTIRKVTADGMVTTIAGIAGHPGSTNGIGTAAQLSNPAGLAVDAAGNLYVADRGNSTIRKIDPAGNVSTLAGVTGIEGSSDGGFSDALFSFPVGLAVDLSGVVYVADSNANTVRMIRSAAPQPPMLRMKIVAGLAKVCWPASAAGFILESRSDLSPNGSWAPVQITPVVEGCNFVVTTTFQTPAAFFRLQHP